LGMSRQLPTGTLCALLLCALIPHIGALAEPAPDEPNSVPAVGSGVMNGINSLLTSTTGTGVTSMFAGVVEEQAELMLQSVMTFFNLSKEMVAQLIGMAANLGFCAVLLLGFYYLSPDVMLVVGLLTFFIGPILVLLCLDLAVGVFILAANNPLGFVLLISLLAFLRSKIGQAVGRSLGLDVTKDGTVGYRDLLAAVQGNSWYQGLKEKLAAGGFTQLYDVETVLAERPATIESVHERIDGLEKKLDQVLAALNSGGSASA